MKQFRLVDNIIGWLTFFVAAFVYCSTIEPTASFWDCPEFITTGYRLEVGHPPGAPFFMLTANLFSQFASSPSTVAYMVNMMSALLSATCILFLFWSITHLARRLLIDNVKENLPLWKLIAIEGSGLVGALIYTFSDTFWFSAVEGEVYAYSSAFTAVVFWLILKWEEHADEPHSDRWLVLIMYMTGLSIGVHLLNLLCLPAIVLVWYYKRFPNANVKGSIVALIVSIVLLAAVLYGVVPGIITVGGWFELFFVNTIGMSFNTGVYIYLILLVALVIWAIYETQHAQPTKQSWMRQNIAFLLAFAMLGVPFYGFGWSAFFTGIVVLAIIAAVLFRRTKTGPLIPARLKNTTLLCMLMLMIGYSSYAIIVIRSSANPPMDQNSPEDIFTLGNYLSRDQYGYRPLVWGQAYNSEYLVDNSGRVTMDEGAPMYQRREKHSANEKDSYFIVSTKDKPVYAQNMLFPRMYSNSPRHIQFYESWLGGVEGNEKPSNYRDGKTVKIPTQFENLRWFFSYQCNWMYWRYFLWNFAGRQNDIQGQGEVEHGNWLTGISFIDNARLGDQNLLPDVLKNNKGHNVFYCLPLILGLIGIFWQVMMRNPKGIKQFWVVFFLFFMTGLAIVIYLNQTPEQPRERDYAYAGSFYAYAIWCGLGVAAIISWLNNLMKKQSVAIASIVTIATIAIPIQMGSQTWDDHDRSGRYTCRDFGQNYLMSLQSEVTDSNGNTRPCYPIIFTNGDNDTFPLWYAQEVEGIRPDVLIVNLSLLGTDWYCDQMKRRINDAPPAPITMERSKYVQGTRDVVYVVEKIKERTDLKQAMTFVASDNPATRLASQGERPIDFLPAKHLSLPVDRQKVLANGTVAPKDSALIVPQLEWTFNKSYMQKNTMMVLEILANNNWERPLYFVLPYGDGDVGLSRYLQLEGFAYRLVPIRHKPADALDIGRIDTDILYRNLMEKFTWGRMNEPDVFIDYNVQRTALVLRLRNTFARLAQQLHAEGETDRAIAVLDRLMEILPHEKFPFDFEHDYFVDGIIEAYYVVGQTDKANALMEQYAKLLTQNLNYLFSLESRYASSVLQDKQIDLQILGQLYAIAQHFAQSEIANAIGTDYSRFASLYQQGR